MSEVLKKFGRYFLLDRIAQGGMAEIYRARIAAAGGAARLLVIKRIQTSFGENAEFLQMFKAEIQVTMGFNHPNIVQVYDFGEEQAQPFIAMEFVDGRNARQFLNRFLELKQSMPIEVATYIAEQAASGLHYAHSFKDKISGESLQIVHRDISPQNILISYDGTIKVIDFGIAKATTNAEATRAGVIKGKPSYLSPEQISGEVLDGRSDIFALGTVLWELLTGKKLFVGESDLAVLKLIESSQTHIKAPSTINPKVPKELDQIVMKALAKHREKRYQNSEEMQRALHKFLYSFIPEFNPADLSYHAKDLFKNEIIEDRKKIQLLSQKAEELLAVHTSDGKETGNLKISDDEDGTITNIAEKNASSGGRVYSLKEQENSKLEVELSDPKKNLRPPTQNTHTQNPRPQFTKSQIRTKPASSKNSIIPASVAVIGGIALLSIFGPSFGIQVPLLSSLLSSSKSLSGSEMLINNQAASGSIARGVSAVGSGTFSPAPTLVGADSDKSILLKLNLVPNGGNSKIILNGKTLDPKTPSARVPLDSPLDLSIERTGYRSLHREFVLDSSQVNGLKEWQTDVTLEPLHFGYLTIHTAPSADATIRMEDTVWMRKTPIENEKIPVGNYTIDLKNDVLGMEKVVSITIKEGQTVNIDERLEIKN